MLGADGKYLAKAVLKEATCSPEIEAEGGPGQDADPVPHHGHLVQRRLPVENDNVPITHVPFNLEKGGKTSQVTYLQSTECTPSDSQKKKKGIQLDKILCLKISKIFLQLHSGHFILPKDCMQKKFLKGGGAHSAESPTQVLPRLLPHPELPFLACPPPHH